MTNSTLILGEKIKQIRQQRKMSQQFIADETGLARSTVNSIERNSQRPSVEFIKKFCELTEVSADSILFDVVPEFPIVNHQLLQALATEKEAGKRVILIQEISNKISELETALKAAQEEKASARAELKEIKDEMTQLISKLKHLF